MKKLLLALALLCGCQTDATQLNDDDRRFAALYADILLLHADYARLSNNGIAFSKADSLNKIFSIHRISSEQFNLQLSRYKDDPARWLKVQDYTLSLLQKWRERNPFSSQHGKTN